jgi:hypothetical protein
MHLVRPRPAAGERDASVYPRRRRPIAGRWAARLVAAIVLFAGPARAAAPEAAKAVPTPSVAPDDCAIVQGLSEIDAEQALLRALCQQGAVADPATASAAIFRVMSLPKYRAAALARVLERRAGDTPLVIHRQGATPPDVAAAQGLLARLSAGLVAAAAAPPATAKGRKPPPHECAELRTAVERYLDAVDLGEPAGTPFLYDDPALLRCLGPDAALTGVRLVTLRADNVESVLVATATRDAVTATWLKEADALVFGGKRFFVAAVPPSAMVLAIGDVHNVEVPAVWRGLVSYDLVAWTEPPALTCVSLDVDLDPDAKLFIDGTAVPDAGPKIARTFAVTRDDHQLVVVQCPKDRRCYVRYQDVLASDTLQTRVNECRAVRLDLSTHVTQKVAILDAKQGEGCKLAPLRADGVRRVASSYLGSQRLTGYEVTDLGTYAAANDALMTLRGRLNQGPGAATGPETGADNVDLISGAAREAWRQGLDVLLSFELHCVERDGAWSYTLQATRIFLNSVFSRGQLSSKGLDLRRFVETETEELTGLEQLDHALEMIVDRSLGVGYVRLLHQRLRAPYRRDPEIHVARHDERDPCPPDVDAARAASVACRDRRIVVTARRLGGPERPQVCARLDQYNVRPPELLAAARQAYDRASGRVMTLAVETDAISRANARAGVDHTRLRVHVPGWYLVLARWDDPKASESDAICVELDAANAEIWGDVALSGKDLHLLPRDNPEALYVRTRVGYTRYLHPWVGLGVFLGYAYTRYVLKEGRPVWDDLGSLDNSALEWGRHAVLAGGVVEVRSRLRALPFDLRLRTAPTVSLGVLSLGAIPEDLRHFLGAQGDKVSKLDIDFNLHFDFIASYQVGRATLSNMMMLGLDAINDRLRQVTTGVRSNAGVFIGFGLAVGGAP